MSVTSRPMSAGRGGSVSRRDHNQAAGNRTQLAGETTFAETLHSIASRSSGGGPGEELLSEKLPPPEFSPKVPLVTFPRHAFGLRACLRLRQCRIRPGRRSREDQCCNDCLPSVPLRARRLALPRPAPPPAVRRKPSRLSRRPAHFCLKLCSTFCNAAP